MRELIAWMVCLLTLCVVTALAYLFAVRHNTGNKAVPSPPATVAVQEPVPPANSASSSRGEGIFDEQKCKTCHSMKNAGNPRYPLDGIGSRMNPAEIQSWITGTGMAAQQLSSSVRKRKQSYQRLSEQDMAALVDYLLTESSSVPGE